MRHTFKAYERLKREQHIDTLFRTGKAYSVFPVRMIYRFLARTADEKSPVRVGFSVPKKKFRKAVQRNKLKRLLREAWRLSKEPLYQAVPDDRQVHVFIVFTGPEIPAFPELQQRVGEGIRRLIKELSRDV